MMPRLLRLQLWARHINPLAWITLAVWLLAAIAAISALLARVDLTEKQQALARDSAEQARLEQAPAQLDPLAQFRATLGARKDVPGYLAWMFEVAERHTLQLRKGSYAADTNSAGNYQRFQVELPVKGSYAQIKQFCRDVLLDLPFSSLDEITSTRQNTTETILEANLKFSLFLHAAPDASSAFQLHKPAAEPAPAVPEVIKP